MRSLLSSIFFNIGSPGLLRVLARKRRLDRQLQPRKKQKIACNVPPESSPDIVEKQLKNSPVEFQGSNAVVYLEPGQMLSIDGCAMVRLEEGQGSMQGYSLTRGVDVLVYSSSRLCSALTFETSQSHCKLVFSSYSLDDPIDNSLSFKFEFFDNSPVKIDDVEEEKAASRKRKLIMEEQGRRIRPTLVPSEWSVTMDKLLPEEHLVVPICGDKGVGKSTFARILVNKLLSRYKSVAYLDIDVGQPEFTIPGCLSLHIIKDPIIGSPVSHLRDPERCFYYGDMTPKSDPPMYLKYFKELLDYFRQLYYKEQEGEAQVPLVINSPGWRTGVGYDLLVDILSYAGPTHVIEIGSDESANLPSLSLTHSAPIFHMKSASQEFEGVTKTAAQLRALRILSYFQKPEKRFDLPPFEEAAEMLVNQVPYQVSLDDVNICHLHTEVPASQSLYSLNAQLVGLGVSTSTRDEHVPCVGFGIVRGVDLSKRLLHVLTPCSLEQLEAVDTILHGRVEIPAALLQVEGYMCPYLCRTGILEGTGSSILQRRQLSAFKRKREQKIEKQFTSRVT